MPLQHTLTLINQKAERSYLASSTSSSTTTTITTTNASAATTTTSRSAMCPSFGKLTLASSCPKKRAGRKKFRETRHPVFRGVRKRDSGKWVCEVREPNKKSKIWLGTYPTLEMAARAHDVAALALRGRAACLNFADSVWRLPVPASAHPRDIQKAAAEAAEAFRAQEYSNQNEEELPENAEKEDVFDVEDEVFGLPSLLASMAEGLLLPPPYCAVYAHDRDDDDDYGAEVSLWNFSI